MTKITKLPNFGGLTFSYRPSSPVYLEIGEGDSMIRIKIKRKEDAKVTQIIINAPKDVLIEGFRVVEDG